MTELTDNILNIWRPALHSLRINHRCISKSHQTLYKQEEGEREEALRPPAVQAMCERTDGATEADGVATFMLDHTI